MTTKAFVLLSGGIDSTTCLHLAIGSSENVEGISINYGQRHLKEIAYAQDYCERLGVAHTCLPAIVPRTMLTDASVAIPDVTYEQISGVSPTYVPFRNGLFLSTVAALAQAWCKTKAAEPTPYKPSAVIYFGAHAEDAANWAYPDCTPEFVGAMACAIMIGTYQQVRLVAPLQNLTKKEVVEVGYQKGVDFTRTWSCYAGGDKHCGACPTCHARHAALVAALGYDPTEYANT